MLYSLMLCMKKQTCLSASTQLRYCIMTVIAENCNNRKFFFPCRFSASVDMLACVVGYTSNIPYNGAEMTYLCLTSPLRVPVFQCIGMV